MTSGLDTCTAPNTVQCKCMSQRTWDYSTTEQGNNENSYENFSSINICSFHLDLHIVQHTCRTSFGRLRAKLCACHRGHGRIAYLHAISTDNRNTRTPRIADTYAHFHATTTKRYPSPDAGIYCHYSAIPNGLCAGCANAVYDVRFA